MATEGLLDLISELTTSECDRDRTRTTDRFKERSQVISTKITHLVRLNSSDLATVLEECSKTLKVLSKSKAKCQDVKERIVLCKQMLESKRDEIRKLWLDSLQHKYSHEMLQEIKNLLDIPQLVTENLHSKNYIEATEILMASMGLLEGKFSDVDALNDLRAELSRSKEKLYLIFMEELKQELYWSSFYVVFNAPFHSDENVTYEKIFKNRISNISDGGVTLNSSRVECLLKCINLLGKSSETLELLKEGCQSELIRMCQKLSKLMFDVLQKSTERALFDLPISQQERFLVDLLQTVLDHFRSIVLNYKEILLFLELIPSAGASKSPIQLADVYSNVQTTIEHLVSAYLDQQPLTDSASFLKVSVFSGSHTLSDLGSFFLPRTNEECCTLFKFSNSSDGIENSKKKSIKEQLPKPNYNNADSEFKNLILVCKPALKNITLIFSSLKQFVSEIENLLPVEYKAECTLHIFLNDTVHSYLDQVNSEINRILENASINLESWTVALVAEEGVDSEKQILSSTLIFNDNLKGIQQLITHLPDYCNHFLHLIYNVILEYKDILQSAFRHLFGEEHNILSVLWAKDRDIRRLLKSFSNWKHLEETKMRETMTFPEEVRLRNKEESKLLIRNLHSEELGSWGIIKDFEVLLNLAVLQESSQWFSVQLCNFMTELAKQGSEFGPCGATEGFKKLIKEYEDFADVCLLALHLEVRAHCFHYLLPPSEQDVDFDAFFSQEFELSVHSLTADLAKIGEVLHPVLTFKELKYVFEGLGELVASILIHTVSNLNTISESFVKKISNCIFVIQCCLSNITLSREVALERARMYIQLSSYTCDDILNEIMEKGPIFNESEYAAVLRLILGKDVSSASSLPSYVSKLREILRKVSVSI